VVLIQVTWFNFTNQLHTLVSDHASCGDLENLDDSLLDPFAKYCPCFGPMFFPLVCFLGIFQLSSADLSTVSLVSGWPSAFP
jgi:hypothetical protein